MERDINPASLDETGTARKGPGRANPRQSEAAEESSAPDSEDGEETETD